MKTAPPLALCFLSALTSAAEGPLPLPSISSPHRFQPFCNYCCDNSTSNCPDPSQFDFVACNQTQTGAFSCTPLEGYRKFRGKWTQGIFPSLEKSTNDNDRTGTWTSKATGQTYRIVNGGAPHYANLSLHLESIKATIDEWIPQRNYTGNIVLDFEAWTPLWEENRLPIDGFHSQIYQEFSLDQMKKEHPQWNDTRIAEESKRQFQDAGMNFFVKTIKVIQELRPKALVGFYGYPGGQYGGCEGNALDPKGLRCGYDNPITGAALRQQNDDMAAIYKASSALYPSVYLRPQLTDQTWDKWRTYNLKYVNDTVQETVRLVKAYSTAGHIPIRSFHWASYHNGTTMLLPQDVAMVAQYTYLPPHSTGVIQWGHPNQRTQIGHWQSTVGAPQMKQAVDLADECSRKHCSNRGWCTQSFLYPKDATPIGPLCICEESYQGPDCAMAVA